MISNLAHRTFKFKDSLIEPQLALQYALEIT